MVQQCACMRAQADQRICFPTSFYIIRRSNMGRYALSVNVFWFRFTKTNMRVEKYVLKRVSFGSKECTKELKLDCTFFGPD